MSFSQTLRTYYYLTKPGIIYGNALMAIAGYLFGAHGSPSLGTFAAMLLGTCAVIASACVYNNVIDRGIDLKMERTKKRAVPAGKVSTIRALVFANVLLLVGVLLLILGTNALTLIVALVGHVAYVVLYGYAKRKTVHGTLVGTLSGSTPPVIGYVAATGSLDLTASLLFLILVAWQMPHFYAIAIFRRDDYAKANIPVLPVVSGLVATRKQIVVYVVLFIAACAALGMFGGASLLSTLVMLLAGGYWLYLCLGPVDEIGQSGWARKQFGWSLMLLIILSATWSLDSFLH
jgi:protoheme IX farnesyltransferase